MTLFIIGGHYDHLYPSGSWQFAYTTLVARWWPTKCLRGGSLIYGCGIIIILWVYNVCVCVVGGVHMCTCRCSSLECMMVVDWSIWPLSTLSLLLEGKFATYNFRLYNLYDDMLLFHCRLSMFTCRMLQCVPPRGPSVSYWRTIRLTRELSFLKCSESTCLQVQLSPTSPLPPSPLSLPPLPPSLSPLFSFSLHFCISHLLLSFTCITYMLHILAYLHAGLT